MLEWQPHQPHRVDGIDVIIGRQMSHCEKAVRERRVAWWAFGVAGSVAVRLVAIG
jgi:hypothetical protein